MVTDPVANTGAHKFSAASQATAAHRTGFHEINVKAHTGVFNRALLHSLVPFVRNASEKLTPTPNAVSCDATPIRDAVYAGSDNAVADMAIKGDYILL